jgi:hypothetical protein
MISFIRTLILGNGAWAAVVAGLVAFGGWRLWDVSKQRAIGAEKAVAKIEKATNDAVKKADAAGRKSAAGGGVRNPYYRAD